jgi:hypothetical protein
LAAKKRAPKKKTVSSDLGAAFRTVPARIARKRRRKRDQMYEKPPNWRDHVTPEQAYARVAPELRELRNDKLLPINLDVSDAVITVLGVVPKVLALRPQLAELSGFDISQVDRLKDYALALNFTHAAYLTKMKPPDDLSELVAEAAKLRARFLAEARLLVHHRIVHESSLAKLRGPNGHLNVVVDLGVLGCILQAALPRLDGKTLTTQDELNYASALSQRVQEILGEKGWGPAAAAKEADQRVRAYTKLMTAYRAIQRAVAYLRGERGDTARIVPNLHKGRPGRRRRKPVEPTPPAIEQTFPQPTPLLLGTGDGS